jgi:hypothetical protein
MVEIFNTIIFIYHDYNNNIDEKRKKIKMEY